MASWLIIQQVCRIRLGRAPLLWLGQIFSQIFSSLLNGRKPEGGCGGLCERRRHPQYTWLQRSPSSCERSSSVTVIWDGQVIHCDNPLVRRSSTVTLIYRGGHLLRRLSTVNRAIIHCGRHRLRPSSIVVVIHSGRHPLRPAFTTAMLLASYLLPACFEI